MANSCRIADDEAINNYRDKLPASLIAEWIESGWCAYSHGLVWIVNPKELTPTVKEWLGTSSQAIPFARSAFGHLFLWDEEGASLLDPQYGTLAKIVNNMEVVFDYVLCRKQYLEDVLDITLFQKALKNLGSLEWDECYGFEPAIALGGSGTLDTLKKMKMREHLNILAQLIDEAE